MKSILKVKIHGIDYYSFKKVVLKKTINVDGVNFIDRVIPPIVVNGDEIIGETIDTAMSQASEWIAGQSDLLKSYIYDPIKELHCILDWEVLSIKNIGTIDNLTVESYKVINKDRLSEQKIIEAVLLTLKEQGTDIPDTLLFDFMHTYEHMRDSLKGLSLDKKMKIVFASMDIGYTAAINAYKGMLLYRSELKNKNKTKLIS